jgi:hypothetical protein
MNYAKWDHLEDSDDEEPAPPEPRVPVGGAEELPPGVPAGAKKVDLNALPPELANDPKLMSELAGRGMLGGGMTKVQATPKGSEKVTCVADKKRLLLYTACWLCGSSLTCHAVCAPRCLGSARFPA